MTPPRSFALFALPVLAALGLLFALLSAAPPGYAARPPGVDVGGQIIPRAVKPNGPLPTATPMPWTLAKLAQDADVVAEVKVAGGRSGPDPTHQELSVLTWLKKGQEALPNTIYLFRRNASNAPLAGDANYIVFLTETLTDISNYSYHLTDETTGIFAVRAGKVVEAGLPTYRNWPVARFTKAVYESVYSFSAASAYLSNLAQQTDVIAEVTFGDSNGATGWILQNLIVNTWLKKPTNVNNPILGLVLDKLEDRHLRLTGSHYIVFLTYRGRRFGGESYDLTNGINGIFELHNGLIRQTTILKYQGWAVADFEAAIRAALAPTPTATSTPRLPTVTPTSTPWTLAKLVQQAEVVAEVTLGDGGPAGAGIDQVRLNVQQWLKKPASPTLTQLALNRYSPDRAHWPRSFWSGEALILFLNRDRPCCSSDEYYLTGGVLNGAPGVYVIRNGKLIYAGLPQYQGWAVADFEAAIRALLAHPELGGGAFPH
jgi:hypothetical protein